MSVHIGINGFGRMGRLCLRAGWDREGISVVQINEIAADTVGSAHLLKFDSVHGTWSENCCADGDTLLIGEDRIRYTSNLAIGDTDWSACDIVIEATGKHHKKPDTMQAYFDQGVKKVKIRNKFSIFHDYSPAAS